MIFPRILAAMLALIITATPAFAQTGESVAAVVNDQPISTFDVRQRTMLLMATTGVQPTQETVARLQEQALRSLIDEKLQLQEAARFEVEVDDEEINNALARLARQNNVSLQDIELDLRNAGIDPTTLRNQIELYKIHHNETYPTIAQLWDNLTHATDVNGTIDASGRFGPYLKKAPMNEYTKSTTVAAIGAGAATDAWEYDPATGEINAVGFDEDTGTFTSP